MGRVVKPEDAYLSGQPSQGYIKCSTQTAPVYLRRNVKVEKCKISVIVEDAYMALLLYLYLLLYTLHL